MTIKDTLHHDQEAIILGYTIGAAEALSGRTTTNNMQKNISAIKAAFTQHEAA